MKLPGRVLGPRKRNSESLLPVGDCHPALFEGEPRFNSGFDGSHQHEHDSGLWKKQPRFFFLVPKPLLIDTDGTRKKMAP